MKKQTLNADNVWKNCLKFLKDNISEQNYAAWFSPIKPKKIENNVLTIQVPTKFFYEWIEESDNHLIKEVRVSKNALFEDFTEQYTDYKRYLTKKKFNIWLKAWGKHKGVKVEEGNTQGTRWITFMFKGVDNNVLEKIEF